MEPADAPLVRLHPAQRRCRPDRARLAARGHERPGRARPDPLQRGVQHLDGAAVSMDPGRLRDAACRRRDAPRHRLRRQHRAQRALLRQAPAEGAHRRHRASRGQRRDRAHEHRAQPADRDHRGGGQRHGGAAAHRQSGG